MPPRSEPIQIPLDHQAIALDGDLVVPTTSRGVVVFAHGSGSGRHSPRNRAVAASLQQAGFATLLMDLLTAAEEATDRHTAHLRFDIELLARRLDAATAWLALQPETSSLSVGYFGASTGAAAALIAATRNDRVRAIVSRGGRPDLAGSLLPAVKAPTLLIVGGEDGQVIALNQRALNTLRCPKQLTIVPGATHLFEEPGALEQVMTLAAQWFERYL
ncbi:MAG: dienelactone hydrolase family protein [Nannocystis sp.]|nr:dienelactone hydrolase family protein [Nannocystis sp.]MBA3547102.1 dienelactone hydrolase family protein [Nannocystis sp.]